MNKPIRCTTHFHACDCREYEFEKVKRQLEIQTKRVENLKKSNEFYANRGSWVKDYDMSGEMTYFVSIQCRDYEETNHLTKLGGMLARSCQAIDQELEKQMEEVK